MNVTLTFDNGKVVTMDLGYGETIAVVDSVVYNNDGVVVKHFDVDDELIESVEIEAPSGSK